MYLHVHVYIFREGESRGCTLCTCTMAGHSCNTIFSPCVLMLQAKEIDLIHGHAVEASENVKDGNEKVRGVSSTVVLYM